MFRLAVFYPAEVLDIDKKIETPFLTETGSANDQGQLYIILQGFKLCFFIFFEDLGSFYIIFR